MKNKKNWSVGKRMDFEGWKNKGLGWWNVGKTTNEMIKAIRYKTKKTIGWKCNQWMIKNCLYNVKTFVVLH
jgi:hypothetical protein